MQGVTFLITRANVGRFVSSVIEVFGSAFAPAASA
jgi:hypothetical protein